MEQEAPLHGDLLEILLSHMSLLDLVPASRVSKAWRRAVYWTVSSNPARAKPWLFLHIQSRRNPAATSTHAYDPYSRAWIQIPHVPNPHASALRSSHSTLLFTHSLAKLSLSTDAFHAAWADVPAPDIWRKDPAVGVAGTHVVVAGGACDYEDEPLSVEVFDAAGSRRWRKCQPMPAIFRDSSSATCLSVAADEEKKKIHVLDKNSGGFCSFDPTAGTWGPETYLRPNPSLYFSTIQSSGNRLILVGLIGDPTDVQGLCIWEVKDETFECAEMGRMPGEMLEELKKSDLPLWSIGVSAAANFAYVYDPYDPEDIFCCDFSSGICSWTSVRNSIINDGNKMDRLSFTCSKVGMEDLNSLCF
ncbi:hypothetical protein ACLOJK_032555 [Asimina triloba]